MGAPENYRTAIARCWCAINHLVRLMFHASVKFQKRRPYQAIAKSIPRHLFLTRLGIRKKGDTNGPSQIEGVNGR